MEITFKNKVTGSKITIDDVLTISCITSKHIIQQKTNKKWILLPKKEYEILYITNFSN